MFISKVAKRMKSTMPKKLKLPKLNYNFDELEPVYSERIMKLHYEKHHGAYVANYNKLLGKYDSAVKEGNIKVLSTLNKALLFHAGGHFNHTLLWKTISPPSQNGGKLEKLEKSGGLYEAISSKFGSYEQFIDLATQKAVGVQGSGWGWLFYTKEDGLRFGTTKDQETVPLMFPGGTPILGIDVWEHAYYLKFENNRAAYCKEFWNVVNWEECEKIYLEASDK